MSNALAEIKKAKKEITELKKQLQKKVKATFHDAVKELFKENPKLTSISWTQYTPYFNDGDACTFSSNHEYADINGDEEDNDEEVDSGLTDKELGNLEKTVHEFLRNFDDDDMLSMFGDHVKVVVTAKNIEAEEYSHD